VLFIAAVDSADVAAAATVALAILTAAYVVVTGRMASSASRSAKHSKDAALSAERAAEAMRESNELARASLDVGFDVHYYRSSPSNFLHLRCTGSTVYVRGATLEYFFGIHESDSTGAETWRRWEEDNVSLQPGWERSVPVLLHRGESIDWVWPGPDVDWPTDMAGGTVLLEYGFGRTDESRHRRLPINFRDQEFE
jgi:hypothetical protein